MARVMDYMAGNRFQLNSEMTRFFLVGRKTQPTLVRIAGDKILTLQNINILELRVSFNLVRALPRMQSTTTHLIGISAGNCKRI
jgi:hypothetical protein